MPRRYATQEVCELIGATYRQVDYWLRKGYIKASQPYGKGSGSPREWSEKQLARARCFMDYVNEGYTLPVAARKVREEM